MVDDGQTDDGRQTDDGPWLYNKLTNEPKGSGELIKHSYIELFNILDDIHHPFIFFQDKSYLF